MSKKETKEDPFPYKLELAKEELDFFIEKTLDQGVGILNSIKFQEPDRKGPMVWDWRIYEARKYITRAEYLVRVSMAKSGVEREPKVH